MSMEKTKQNVTSTVAKLEDGTVQITYVIPWSEIKSAQEKTLDEFVKTTAVPGFRKGKAPKDKVKEKVSYDDLIQKSLATILPEALAESINKEGLKPAIYPKFELVAAEEGKDWQIRAITCELPEFSLGDYKDKLKGELKAGTIWTPEKGSPKKEEGKEVSEREKEQKILEFLLKYVEIKIPKLLTDEEVNSRLSSLLEKIEKLGLALESYLSSLGKDVNTLRAEYEKSASENISLELILNKIAMEEKIEVTDKEIEELKKVALGDKTPQSHEADHELTLSVKHLLLRKKALEYLSSLA